MATWQQVRKGKLARRRVLLPLGTAPLPLPAVGADGVLSFPSLGDDVAQLDVRILTPGEHGDVLARAHAEAKAKGVEAPADGSPIYDQARIEWTVLLGCVDPDSPDDAPRAFFASVEEIRKSPDLGSEKLAYLFEMQRQFEVECAPRHERLGIDEMLAGMLVLGGEDEESAARFFVSLGPGLQWIFMRTLALRSLTSPSGKSPSGSPTAASSTDSSTSTPDASLPAPKTEPEPTLAPARKKRRARR